MWSITIQAAAYTIILHFNSVSLLETVREILWCRASRNFLPNPWVDDVSMTSTQYLKIKQTLHIYSLRIQQTEDNVRRIIEQ